MRRSLTREERLRSREDIQRVFKAGKAVRTNGMRLAYLSNGRPYNRIVVIPARGFRTAIKRNLCRRHGKEAYRALKPDIATGFDLAIVCYPGEYSFAERRNQLSSLLTRAHLNAARSSKEM
ncbi:MAG: ribonuclease P protein component [Spirochaetota bacterium]